MQAASRWRGPHLLNTVALAVADGLFGLFGSEPWDELFIGTRPPIPHPTFPPLSHVPNKPYVTFADVKHHNDLFHVTVRGGHLRSIPLRKRTTDRREKKRGRERGREKDRDREIREKK